MAEPVFSIQMNPGVRTFASLTETQSTFPGLKVPRSLPTGAKLAHASWQFPPAIIVKKNGDHLELDHLDYNVAPTLNRGHVQLVFSVSGGSLIIDQGEFAFLNPATSKQFGPPTSLRLSNGRQAWSKDIRSTLVPRGALRVVGWLEEETGFQLSVASEVLSLDQLALVAASL
jgi:hypothetical protein